jgi:EAL domain-containing protein (putative c-di-GMP-specific phosphodiesterase class I)/CheY-like chemotaxis protein
VAPNPHVGNRRSPLGVRDRRASAVIESQQSLQGALDRSELRLLYQPKVALDTDRIIGAEALLRWEHPERGVVLPDDFVPLAEATGLIVPIGAWVIEEACRQSARWQRSFPDRPGLVMSVNVSASQFGPALVDVVVQALTSTGVEPGKLCLEVTESILMTNVDAAIVILQELADLGVMLSVDDFGTGYSSLAQLKCFPIHELKIDKAFVDGLGRDPDDTAIIATVVAMAHALSLRVVAEGVETAEQLQRLRTLGCEQVQGYYFARPGPAQAISELITGEQASSWLSHEPEHESGDRVYDPDRAVIVDNIAEDSQFTRLSLTALGFEVRDAVDGPEALALAKQFQPDLILLELRLPDMTGFDVCRALRSDPTTAHCCVVILTSNPTASAKVKAFASGADDYMVKPVSPRDLASRVRSAMRRRSEEDGGRHRPAAPGKTSANARPAGRASQGLPAAPIIGRPTVASGS